jgi:hypothetical protein
MRGESCNYPAAYLLQCRHVIALNIFLHRRPFWHEQVGKRWLRYYKPLAVSEDGEVPSGPPPPLYEGPLQLPNTSLQKAAPTTGRLSRYGELQGYCLTICTLAADFKDIFQPTVTKLDGLARWVESVTSVTGTDVVPSSATAATGASASPAPLSSLHPTVPISDMQFPAHKKRQPGRTQEKRQEAASERAAKKVRISASQAG